MDWYRKMELDTKGMIKIIDSYTSASDPMIVNISEVLINAFENKKIDEIAYCLNEFQIWYMRNINEILSNEFVFNKQSHIDAKEKLDYNIKELQNYINNGEDIIESEELMMDNSKVFISHSSADKSFGDVLVELLRNIGLSRQQIVYTSDDDYGIPQGEDIFAYLKAQISNNARMIFMLSDNYYSSIACLNEMGAAWVTGNSNTILFVPGFAPNDDKFYAGAINPRTIGFSMDNKKRLIEFKNILIKEFKLSLDENDWENAKDTYLEKIAKISN